MKKEDVPGRKWWKEAIVYQVYPRSFMDSNGDGIGDLRGIISKLDYIRSLGVDVVWLNPIYSSPNDDNGYDISDYCAIMAEFGTMEDFDELLQGLHERGLKLVMDLVVNHTSDEHAWFRNARSSRTNPYRHYYLWWPAEKGDPPYRPSFFDEKGNAWRYERKTKSYFLHIFSVKQPDLNWDNPHMRKDIFDMMKFWLDKGVDGFRMDAITYIAKDENFPRFTEDEIQKQYGEWSGYYASHPALHDYLHEMYTEVLSKYDIMTVAEGPGISPEEAHKIVDPSREELNMLYHFEGMGIGYVPGEFKKVNPGGYDLIEFKKVYTKWDEVFARKGWGTIYLGNHDQPRMVSRWGNDQPEFRAPSAKMLITFLFTMHATPFFFAGDEIGMKNIRFDSISEYKDIETLNMYKQIKKKKGDLKRFLANQKESARDNSRTPFQWSGGRHAGFTTGKPWITVNSDHVEWNAEAQESDPESVLQYFRAMIRVRREHTGLLYGRYQLLEKDHKQLYVYTRTLESNQYLVLLNFSKTAINYALPEPFRRSADVLINNYATIDRADSTFRLQPYQAIVIYNDGGAIPHS
ncbi:MAG TPA: alpha-glucosidase [Chitinophagaceae bacterium]